MTYYLRKGDDINMKVENSSKCMYIRNTTDIPLKWKDIRNADITPNRRYMQSIADIPKLGVMKQPHNICIQIKSWRQ